MAEEKDGPLEDSQIVPHSPEERDLIDMLLCNFDDLEQQA